MARSPLETGDYDATFERDGSSIVRARDPNLYRFELQGPNALALMEKVSGAPVPPIKFFHMATFTIGGLTVRSLRHGMARQPGFELFGPCAEGERVRSALIEAGKAFDLVLIDGADVGISHDVGYISNEHAFVSLASIATEHATPGTEVHILWGEDPNSHKPAVEPHREPRSEREKQETPEYSPRSPDRAQTGQASRIFSLTSLRVFTESRSASAFLTSASASA